MNTSMCRTAAMFAGLAVLLWVTGPAFGEPHESPVQDDSSVTKFDWLTVQRDGFRLEFVDIDSAEVAPILSYLESGRETIRAFFGEDFPREFTVHLYPTREAMDRAWRAEWNMPELKTECWMVASGIANSLSILSPRAWASEACEHKADDTVHIREIVTHEMVHVYHGQHNPHPDFDGMDAMGWFPEGLAVLVSGQLDREHRGRARTAIESGEAPAELESAFSGAYRYGVSGSLVRYIDITYGRATLRSLLECISEKEILDLLDISEPQLLNRWRAFVLAQERDQ